MRYLIDEYNCDPVDTSYRADTVLHRAAACKSLDAMKYLINHHHCDPIATNNEDKTVLHIAAIRNISPDVIKYLINECNCDPMAVDKEQWTPLHWAAYWGRSAVVECLLSTGKCDPLAKDNKGKTPLELAKDRQQRDIKDLVTIIEELTILNQLDCTKWIQFGLHLGLYDPRLKTIETDYKGKTVECFHEWYGWLNVTKDLVTKYHCDPQERGEGDSCLHWAACHCDPMETDKYGDTVLHKAANKGSLDVLKYLINECQYNPMATDPNSMTILHNAAISNSPDVIKYLINECHLDPITVNWMGQTPLHIAVDKGYSAAVESLLSTGKCDPLAKDNKGKTPLQLAKEEVIEIKSEVFNKDTTIKLELTILNHYGYSNWYEFGLHLGLYDPTLNAIKKDHKECKPCLIQYGLSI
ncbi:PREDICTED: espin-like [Amphimedon queenslandica]|uniref:Death domain-containing protein n=1 Tax=Amphimedon queenslandica TaxID=400682 RepID=A0AAN0JEV9_AMPQE|nr:PREDICTED: espin-like [Amphimedon queenslandica]|eukprot:XP_019855297.1 PREDICTED: espin-like [Amphimedon queenslandica]